MKRILSFIFAAIFFAFAINYSAFAMPASKMVVKAQVKDSYTRIFFFYPNQISYIPVLKGDNLKIKFDKDFIYNAKDLEKISKDNNIRFVSTGDFSNELNFVLDNPNYAYRKFIGENFVGIDLIKQKVPSAPAIKQAKMDVKPKAKPKPNKKEAKVIRQYEQAALSAKIAALDSSSGSVPLEEVQVEQEIKQEDIENINDIEQIYEERAKPKEVVEVKYKELARINFPWDEEVGAAFFNRGGYLWVVFDKYKEIDTSELLAEYGIFFTEVEQIENKYYTILRLSLKEFDNFHPVKDENNWNLIITQERVPAKYEPSVEVEVSELLGSKVIVDGYGDIKPIRLIDPFVGDEMVIVPYKDASVGFNVTRKYTDFSFIKTFQGVSIELIADNIDIESDGESVGVAGPTNKLAGSAQSSLQELRERERKAKLLAERLKQKGGELTQIQFNNWKLNGDKEFENDLESLYWKITEVNWSDKSLPRLNLARFYLSHNMYYEALGVIKIIREYDEEFARKNEVKIVEAAALYFSGKYEDAFGVLNEIETKDMKDWQKEEINFWKAATSVQINNLIKIDQFMSDSPIAEEKVSEDESGDEVENTKLMWDTTSRLLKIIRKMDPDFVNADEIQKLESTARFVTNHYHEAIKRFEESDLYRSGDVFQAEEDQLWWSTAEVTADNTDAIKIVENLESFLKYYPDQVYNDFVILALEERLKKNDLVIAEELIALLKDEKRPQEKNSIEFLKGLFFAKDEEKDKAIEIWKALAEDVDDGYNRLRAQFAMTTLLIRDKEIDVSEAIKRLNGVRTAWRGDKVEFHLLKILGELYMEEKQYMEGFRVWRNTVTAFSGSDEALLIAKKMSDKFVQVFSQGGADELDKFEAITLYYEFRELTPIGKLGDEMISRLASRLIEVDLLERAAALLTHQVRFRLIGEEKQDAVIKLVNVHLMNQNPRNALDVLNATQQDDISPERNMERKYLKARALIELDKSNSVLELLRGDDSHKASFLRAEVYWKNKVWRKVVEELETPFREIRRAETTLTSDETEQILRLAVAYALTERKKRLQILYEDFVPFVNDNEQKKIFTFVATDRGPVDYRNLDSTVEFKSIKSFLGKYIETNAANIGEGDEAMAIEPGNSAEPS